MSSQPTRPTRTPNPYGWPDQHYNFMYGKAVEEGESIKRLVLRAIEALAEKDGMFVTPGAELRSGCRKHRVSFKRGHVSQWMLRKQFFKCKLCVGEHIERREAWYRQQADKEKAGQAGVPTPITAASGRR